MQDKVLKISHMKKIYGDLVVLKDISLAVHKGEVVSIIGPSGSGKSTLLRCATMLEKMDGGELTYLGERAAYEESGKCVYVPKADLKRIRKHYGLVFQNFNLFPHYTVLKNIMDAPVSVDKVPKAEAKERAISLLKQLGLEDKMDVYPHQLSGGQQQRVSIARALALQPQILFFDEPTSALDPELTGEVLKVIRSLAERETTMIIVTHEMDFARDVADQIIFMDDGFIVEQGPPEQVIGNPREERTRQFLNHFSKE